MEGWGRERVESRSESKRGQSRVRGGLESVWEALGACVKGVGARGKGVGARGSHAIEAVLALGWTKSRAVVLV